MFFHLLVYKVHLLLLYKSIGKFSLSSVSFKGFRYVTLLFESKSGKGKK